MVARADYIVDVVAADVSRGLQTLPGTGRRGIGRNLAVWDRDCSGRLLASTPQSMGHCRPSIPLDLSGMANLAAIRASRLSRRRCRILYRGLGVTGLRSCQPGENNLDQQNERRQ